MTAVTTKQFNQGAREAIASVVCIIDAQFQEMIDAYTRLPSSHYMDQMAGLIESRRKLCKKLGQSDNISMIDFARWINSNMDDTYIASAFNAWQKGQTANEK